MLLDFPSQPIKATFTLCLASNLVLAFLRAFTSREARYYKFIEDKVSYLWDLYDFGKKPYCRQNPLENGKSRPAGARLAYRAHGM